MVKVYVRMLKLKLCIEYCCLFLPETVYRYVCVCDAVDCSRCDKDSYEVTPCTLTSNRRCLREFHQQQTCFNLLWRSNMISSSHLLPIRLILITSCEVSDSGRLHSQPLIDCFSCITQHTAYRLSSLLLIPPPLLYYYNSICNKGQSNLVIGLGGIAENCDSKISTFLWGDNQSINQSISKLITRRNLSIRQLRGAEYQWSVECTAV